MQLVDRAFSVVVHASWQAGLLALVVLVVHALLGRWMSARARYAMWVVVMVRCVLVVGVLGIDLGIPRVVGVNTKPQAVGESVSKNGLVMRVEYGPVPGGLVANARPAVETKVAVPIRVDRRVSFSEKIAMVWVIVAGLLLARVVARAMWFWVRLRKIEEVCDPILLALLEEARGRMGVKRRVRLAWVDDRVSELTPPALTGVFRPTILLSRTGVASLSSDEIRFVFLHELAHVKRWDLLADWAAAILCAVHWFNPIVWYAMYRRRCERELACDEKVLAVCGRGQRLKYGGAVVRVVENLSGELSGSSRVRSDAGLGALGFGENKRQLTRRINMIARFRPGSFWRRAAAVVVVAAVGCMALTDARSQEKAKTTDAKPQATTWPDAANVKSEPAPATQSIAGDEHGVSVADFKVRRALDMKLPELNFSGTGISDVVDFLRDVTGTNIYVNWRGLEAAGIDRDAAVSIRVRDVKFAKALAMVLDDVGGGTVKLGYQIDDGVLTIDTEENLDKNVETRIYDIRDLLVMPIDYPPNAPPTTQGAVATKRQETIDGIEKLISTTVAADSWRDSGGTIGTLQELNGELIITQTPGNHELITALLDRLRVSVSNQVVVEARFLTFDDAALNALPEALRNRVQGPLNANEPDAGKLAFLSADEVNQVLRATQTSKESTLITAPRLTLFNGQHAFVSVGRETAYVADLAMMKTAAGDMKYEPKIEKVNAGMVFDVSATLSADHQSIALGLHPTFTTLIEMQTVPYAAAPASDKVSVQVPLLKTSELNTTVKVPDGATLMLSGLSSSSLAEDGKEASRPLLMLVKARAIVASREK